MNPFRRAHVVFLATLVGCGCAAMLALAPRDREAASGAGEGGRGSSRFLQDALNAARVPGSGVTEIRIAQGEYKPDQGASGRRR